MILPPVTETHPAGYTDDADTAGSKGGTAGNDEITSVTLVGGDAATDYDFTETAPTIMTTTTTAPTTQAPTTQAPTTLASFVPVEVPPVLEEPTKPLAYTGSSSMGMLAAACGLLVSGGFLVAGSRRRRRQ